MTSFKVRELISGPTRTDTRETLSKGFRKAREHTFILTGSNSKVYFGMAYLGEEKNLPAMEGKSDVTPLEEL